MSDMFDPRAIAKGVARRKKIEKAAAHNKRLIDCEHHSELYAMFDKLKGIPGTKHKKVADSLGPTTVYVLGKDGEQNLRVKQTLETAATRYVFPDGVTVTRLRKLPLTFRLDDETGRQLVIHRKRDSDNAPWFWEIMGLPAGFKQHSGKRAGARTKGHGVDRSFD